MNYLIQSTYQSHSKIHHRHSGVINTAVREVLHYDVITCMILSPIFNPGEMVLMDELELKNQS